MSKLNIAQLVASLQDVADDLLDSDIHTAMKLHRIASNIALTAADNEPIQSSSVGPSMEHLPEIVKEAVSETRTERRSKRLQAKSLVKNKVFITSYRKVLEELR